MPKKKDKHLALNPKCHYKSTQDLVDYDYTKKLSETDKDFLDKFSEEYYGARFKGPNSIHPDSDRKQIYRENDRRKKTVLSARRFSCQKLGEEHE